MLPLNKMRKHLHIFDIDGVLLDSSHRYRLMTNNHTGKLELDLAHWKSNQHKASEDTPLAHAEIYKKLLEQHDTFVVLATARKLKAVDFMTIEEKLGEPHAYVSRVTDEQSSSKLKLAGVLNLIQGIGLEIAEVSIYEDNPKNLKVLANGIKTHLQIEPICNFIESTQGI